MPDQTPLVLYYAGPDSKLAIDARAAAELIRERWPGAELVAVPAEDAEETCGVLCDPECTPVGAWILGLSPGYWQEGQTPVDPTPDASIVMQVRRRLRELAGVDHG